jgi:cytochrome c553
MPDVIAHGPKALANGNGCGSCHRPNGRGRSENAQPAGLPYAYIVRQLQDFRLGLRRSADWRKENTPTMIRLASTMSDDRTNRRPHHRSVQRRPEYFRRRARKPTHRMDRVCADRQCGKGP